MLLSDYREDSKKQMGGTPVYVGDATFYLRRLGTPEAEQFIRDVRFELFGAMHKAMDEDNDLVFAHVLCDYAITGWENVFISETEELEYSQVAARKTFLNPEYFMSLNRLLVNEGYNFENYLFDEAEKDCEEIKKP